MTREDSVRMAQEAGFDDFAIGVRQELLERFATLVASAEREAIIKIASDLYYWDHSEELIKAIQTRGQA